MWKPLWMILALIVIVRATEHAVDNEEFVDDTEDGIEKQNGIDINIPGIDKEMPSPDEFLKMLESMSNLTDEEKDDLRKYIYNSAGELNDTHVGSEKNFLYQMALLFSLLAVITVIFVLIGYKLYKSLIERDIRREMKKKQKETKKKK